MSIVLVIISLFFWALAAVCNAGMDVLSFHYEKSIFPAHDIFSGSYYNRWKTFKKYSFWYPGVSWVNKYINHNPEEGEYKYFGWIPQPDCFTDGWHMFKTLMLCFQVASITTALYAGVFLEWYLMVLFTLYGIVWILIFNLFYNHIFIKK